MPIEELFRRKAQRIREMNALDVETEVNEFAIFAAERLVNITDDANLE